MTRFQLVTSPEHPPHYTSSALAIPHGFFGARGGISTGSYTSLNCGYGSDDSAELVAENRRRTAASLGLLPTGLARLYQVHGADCITITDASAVNGDPVKADGMVTGLPGIGLSILTADCLPVLFADERKGVIGACHAGWRGAVSGIIESTITAMRTLGANDITALIGPAIRHASYQIGYDMRDAVYAQTAGALPKAAIDACFSDDPARPDKFLFDLPRLVETRLRTAGLTAIADCGLDTYQLAQAKGGESPSFFSHRHATHANAPDTGRQIAIISLGGA